MNIPLIIIAAHLHPTQFTIRIRLNKLSDTAFFTLMSLPL